MSRVLNDETTSIAKTNDLLQALIQALLEIDVVDRSDLKSSKEFWEAVDKMSQLAFAESRIEN